MLKIIEKKYIKQLFCEKSWQKKGTSKTALFLERAGRNRKQVRPLFFLFF